MTRSGIEEYTEAVRYRYFKATKKEKGRILDEFIRVSGYHRKAAIRLLHRSGLPAKGKRRGRQRCYGGEVVDALRQTWEATDRLCSKRLRPFLGELVRVMRQHGEIHISAPVEAQLCQMSPATIDRLLRPWRRFGGQRHLCTTKPGSLLKSSVPIRTFADWQERSPGFLEADLVAHCGETTEGFYLHTLCCTDVASGWSECIGVWGKDQYRVGAAVHAVRHRLPFSMLGLDSDNGGEFINQHLYTYCQREKITFTRARPYKKNDSCYVEQKNWSVIRRVVGYDRYTSRAALADLNRTYNVLRLYINFFQPVMKLESKTRHGARVHKVYDTAKTPYQRLLESGGLTPAKEAELAAIYKGLNPVALRRQLSSHLERLWKLADRPTSTPPQRTKVAPGSTSVTGVLRQ